MSTTMTSVFTSLLVSNLLAWSTFSNNAPDSISLAHHSPTITIPPPHIKPTATLTLPCIKLSYPPSSINIDFRTLKPLLPPILYAIIFLIAFTHLHARITAFEHKTTTTHLSNSRKLKKFTSILHDLSTALETTGQRTQDAFADLSHRLNTRIDGIADEHEVKLEQLLQLTDDDFAKVHAKLSLFGKMILAIEGNVEQARCLLAGEEDGIEDLRIGDDVEKFWTRSVSGCEDRLDDEVEDVPIEDCRSWVWEWLEECEELEECDDVLEDVQDD